MILCRENEMNFQHSNNPLFELKMQNFFTSKDQKRSTRHGKTECKAAMKGTSLLGTRMKEWSSNHLRCNTYQKNTAEALTNSLLNQYYYKIKYEYAGWKLMNSIVQPSIKKKYELRMFI
jgi:hypothetical protein